MKLVIFDAEFHRYQDDPFIPFMLFRIKVQNCCGLVKFRPGEYVKIIDFCSLAFCVKAAPIYRNM